MTIVKAFNKTLIKFIEELEEKFPQEEDISVYKNSIILLDKTNAKLVSYYYKLYVYIYKPYIDNKDENFFLQNDFSEQTGGSEWCLVRGMRLKNYWKDLSDKSKDVVWEYFSTLNKLAENINY
jgi:hypothetical protein